MEEIPITLDDEVADDLIGQTGEKIKSELDFYETDDNYTAFVPVIYTGFPSTSYW